MPLNKDAVNMVRHSIRVVHVLSQQRADKTCLVCRANVLWLFQPAVYVNIVTSDKRGTRQEQGLRMRVLGAIYLCPSAASHRIYSRLSCLHTQNMFSAGKAGQDEESVSFERNISHVELHESSYLDT